jgi:hypothetical protein
MKSTKHYLKEGEWEYNGENELVQGALYMCIIIIILL